MSYCLSNLKKATLLPVFCQTSSQLSFLRFKHASSEFDESFRTSDEINEPVEESLLPEQIEVSSGCLHSLEYQQNHQRIWCLPDPDVNCIAEEEWLNETFTYCDENEDVETDDLGQGVCLHLRS